MRPIWIATNPSNLGDEQCDRGVESVRVRKVRKRPPVRFRQRRYQSSRPHQLALARQGLNGVAEVHQQAVADHTIEHVGRQLRTVGIASDQIQVRQSIGDGLFGGKRKLLG